MRKVEETKRGEVGGKKGGEKGKREDTRPRPLDMQADGLGGEKNLNNCMERKKKREPGKLEEVPGQACVSAELAGAVHTKRMYADWKKI